MVQYREDDINLIKMMLEQIVVQGITQAKLLASVGSVLEKGIKVKEEKEEGGQDGSRQCSGLSEQQETEQLF